MPPDCCSPRPLAAIPIHERALGRRMFCRNAGFWGLGNGLISTSLVIYVIGALAAGSMDRARIGLAIAWIIAAPRVIGLLRIFAPTLIDAVRSRRRVAFFGYLLSPMALLLLPLALPVLSRLAETRVNLALCSVGAIWAVYHLIEYFATVALWSWLGDLITPSIRPRFLARRERHMIAGQFIGVAMAGLWTFTFYEAFKASGELWRLYLLPTGCGIVFLSLAAFPILKIPEVAWSRADSLRERFRRLIAPLCSRSFLPFLLFGCSVQIAGGLGQSAQSYFQMRILGVSMLVALALSSWTRFGQMTLSGIAGRLISRFGSVRVIAISLGIAASGSLFYAVASPDSPWWIVVAASVWIGWIGVNLGIGNLTIQLAPPEERSSYIAFYFTATTLAFGLSTLAGGEIFDRFRDTLFTLPFCEKPVDYFRLIFIAVAILRALCILPLLGVKRVLRVE